MKTVLLLLVGLLMSWPLQEQKPTDLSPALPLVLQHVTVIDSTGTAPQPDMSVLIERGRIKAISSSREFHPGSGFTVVDATGKVLIAGLWDMHVHALSNRDPELFFRLFVANGITGIRDMGGDIPLSQIVKLKQEISLGLRLGPEIFAAGPILEGEHPFWPFSISAPSAATARRAVDTLVEEHADFLKVYNTLSRQSYLTIASEAKKDGIPFVGHIPDSITPAEASALGQKSIEHLWGIPVYESSKSRQLHAMAATANQEARPEVARQLFYEINQAVLTTHDAKKAAQLNDEFRRNGTWQTPTLVVLRAYASLHDPALAKDPRLAYIPEDLRRFWESIGGPPDPRNDQIQLALFQQDLSIVNEMHTAEVPLLAGTDTPNPYTYPGFSLHEELQLLVSAGLSPMEAIETATLRAAQFLNVDKEFGSVQVGKIADLVLLDASPLDDIQNTKRICAVIVRGRFLDRSSLDSLLAAPQ